MLTREEIINVKDDALKFERMFRNLHRSVEGHDRREAIHFVVSYIDWALHHEGIAWKDYVLNEDTYEKTQDLIINAQRIVEKHLDKELAVYRKRDAHLNTIIVILLGGFHIVVGSLSYPPVIYIGTNLYMLYLLLMGDYSKEAGKISTLTKVMTVLFIITPLIVSLVW